MEAIEDTRLLSLVLDPLPGEEEVEARVPSHVESSVLSYRSLGQDNSSQALVDYQRWYCNVWDSTEESKARGGWRYDEL